MKCGNGEETIEQGNENDSLKNEEGLEEAKGRERKLLQASGMCNWGPKS